ncbi:hypothetical protein ACFQWB_08065 [Paenibacillus thermoaerophilus]|jgi:hypothetical protein|uniref:Uncharacterized protein n=1 Tax=Paenibacillus thermoaerophilus TaxID=1215385 RepID=A0ABW2V181_9BACL|nr:hypothetical protein [Paenibacillus thermoaerophilus]TMV18430.1 hypothetical protein FE781_03165 [Paenibacillus thermoaerophilus]
MDQWMEFLQDRWYVVAIAAVLLLIVLNVVKTVVKWLLVAAIAAGLFWYGGSYIDRIKEVGGEIASSLKDEAVKRMLGDKATYKDNGDGTYTVTSGGVQVDGKIGSSEVKVTYMGQSFTLNLEGAVQTFIEQAQKNQG